MPNKKVKIQASSQLISHSVLNFYLKEKKSNVDDVTFFIGFNKEKITYAWIIGFLLMYSQKRRKSDIGL